MSTPDAARAIVIKDGKLLVIKRTKLNQKYMVTPGGHIEEGEEPTETVQRELDEETTVRIKNPRLVFIENPNHPDFGLQYIYLCEYASGEPQLRPDSEEVIIQANGGGTYEPMWFPLDQMPDEDYPFKSEKVGQEILKGIKFGFPDQPKQWTLDLPVLK